MIDPQPQHPSSVPLWVGLRGLTHLWDRRASEAEGAAAEAYQRAAAETLEVLRALSSKAPPVPAVPPSEQAELGL